MPIVLPEPAFRGTTSSRCIEDFMRPREPQYERMFKPGQETLGHYYLPPFQRPAAWTETQSARLIESVFLGIAIGSIIVSDCGRAYKTRVGDEVISRFPDSADWIIDGQQRMRAIAAYLADELTVFRGTGAEHRFSQLERRDQRRFLGTPAGFITLEAMPEDDLRRVYDLMNFGGTKHTEDQRASAQATD